MLPPLEAGWTFTTAQWGQCSGSDLAWLLRLPNKRLLCVPWLSSPGPLCMQANCREAGMWWGDPNRPHARTEGKCRDLLKRGVQSALSYSRPPLSQLQPLQPEPITEALPGILAHRAYGREQMVVLTLKVKGHLASREKYPETKW